MRRRATIGSSSVRIGAVMRRHWIVLKRAPHRWFEISFWPFMDVLLWGALGVFVAKQNETSRASTPYLLAGITLFWIFTQSQFAIALGVNEETWTRNILNVVTTPIREVEYVVGLALFGLLKTILCVLTLTAATVLLFDFDLSQIGWSALPIAALLIVNGWALGLIAVGFVLRFGQSAEILIWGLNYMLMAFSGVFFPPAHSPPVSVRSPSSFPPPGCLPPCGQPSTGEAWRGDRLALEHLPRSSSWALRSALPRNCSPSFASADTSPGIRKVRRGLPWNRGFGAKNDLGIGRSAKPIDRSDGLCSSRRTPCASGGKHRQIGS